MFSDEKALQAYNALIHPMLFDLIDQSIQNAHDSGAAVCVLDMPLLYEVGLDRLCDKIWCAYAPEEIQIRRLYDRNGLDRETALQRIHSQMSTNEKAARADLVIDTNHPIDETAAFVREVWFREINPEGGVSD